MHHQVNIGIIFNLTVSLKKSNDAKVREEVGFCQAVSAWEGTELRAADCSQH